MRAKKWIMTAVFIMAGAVLTGCGEDAVERQIQSENIPYVDSIYTVNRSDEEDQEKNRILDDVAVWEEKAAFIGEVKKILTEDYVDAYRDGEEMQDIDWTSVKSIKKNSGVSNELDIGSRILHDEEQAKEYCGKLEQLGLSGLSETMDGLIKDMQEAREENDGNNWEDSRFIYSSDAIVASRGIQFRLGCHAEGVTKHNTIIDYLITATIPSVQVVIPTKYRELIQSKVEDGFCIGALNVGGYLERLNLLSSWDEPGNPYQKSVDLYLKDEKPLELDVELERNDAFPGVEKGSEVFTENERGTMIRLVNEFADDESAAEDFVKSFTVNTGKSGTIGKAKWKLRKVDSYHTMLVIEQG